MMSRRDNFVDNYRVREIRHWHLGDETAKKVWSVDFVNLIELLELLGWKIQSKSFFKKLDACRLVVNVYKHGEGGSLKDLKSFYPEYLCHPLANMALRKTLRLVQCTRRFSSATAIHLVGLA